MNSVPSTQPYGQLDPASSKNFWSSYAGLASDSTDVLIAEARLLGHGHVKEAYVGSTCDGHVWKLTSDEGVHLRGTDKSPFPLGFFSAAMAADLIQWGIKENVLARTAELRITSPYSMTGSFASGTANGFAHPPLVELSDSSKQDVKTSICFDNFYRSHLTGQFLKEQIEGGFSLSVNGRQRPLSMLRFVDPNGVLDPFLKYQVPPTVLAASRADAITKSAIPEPGDTKSIQSSGVIKRNVCVLASWSEQYLEMESWLVLPGVSRFLFRSNPPHSGPQGDSSLYPKPSVYLSAGLIFCYMTQLSRYIEALKLKIDGIRAVQIVKCSTNQKPNIESHLFINARENFESIEHLLSVAQNTCYLHAVARSPLELMLTATNSS